MERFRTEYKNFPQLSFLINHVLQADFFLKINKLPQDIPSLSIPENMQNIIYHQIMEDSLLNKTEKESKWEQLSNDLPKLENNLRNFRDYLSETYGMWAYISSLFVSHLANYVDGKKGLEVMAGNGYISKGLKEHHQDIIATDDLSWVKENETGKHLVTKVENLSAMEAFEKYKDQIEYLIMCWSPDGIEIDVELLEAIRNYHRDIPLIVIGEKDGATNSKKFWNIANFIDDAKINELNNYYSHFDLIQDKIYLIK
ncbi:SAM-dependent methyltransferase [Lactobacillus sp. S2-2]|nr:SAM-dependent methyltransferase [Lactobacillus sp. S2-2]